MIGDIVVAGTARVGERRVPQKCEVIGEHGEWIWLMPLVGTYAGSPLTFKKDAVEKAQ